MSSSNLAPLPYSVGDVILVEQGNQLHDARVLELGDEQQRKDGQDVFVHYQGWSKAWDNWARLEHTRADTPESRAEQVRMKAEFIASKSKTKGDKKKREDTGTGTAAKALARSLALHVCHSCRPTVLVEGVFLARCTAHSLSFSFCLSVFCSVDQIPQLSAVSIHPPTSRLPRV